MTTTERGSNSAASPARRPVSEQLAGDVGDVLVVAAAEHDRAVVAEPVLDLHDLAGAVGLEDLDDVQAIRSG